MPQAQPYQALALRILHGIVAALIIIAILTGVSIYNIYDGRIGHLPIPVIPRIMGIHKLFGRAFLLIIPFFALYSFDAGRRRLLQVDSIKTLKAIGKPVWWYTLHRTINTVLLLGATFALVSGREMNEVWMSQGELMHTWYLFHLASWLVMFTCLAMHLLMIVKVGGVPLMLSMFHFAYRSSDSPSMLVEAVQSWLYPKRLVSWLKKHILIQKQNVFLAGIELIVIVGVAVAWISLIPHRI